jgi:chemotaxis protein methyltransferase CheR
MPLSRVDFEYVRALVLKRSAIVLEDDKLYLAESRLTSLARREGIASIDALLVRLRAEPNNGLVVKVVEAMTTNETFFFRDVYPFEALRLHLLPELMRRRASERRLDIWCAAASTGQEPYSLVMLLREHFPELAGWTVRLLATDLSTEVLARAREGRYSQLEVNRGLPARLLVRYFRQQGAEWQIKDEIRKTVEFRPLNLIEPWPAMPAMDLVLMRNVLIYFDVDTKKQILSRVTRLLRPDGYLMLGGAETTLNLDDSFERVDFDRCGAYRLRPRVGGSGTFAAVTPASGGAQLFSPR